MALPGRTLSGALSGPLHPGALLPEMTGQVGSWFPGSFCVSPDLFTGRGQGELVGNILDSEVGGVAVG